MRCTLLYIKWQIGFLFIAQKSKEELENEEMEKFTELYTEWKGPEKTSETYKMIPKFYFKVPLMH